MSAPLPVELVLVGRPFDDAAVLHTLRHLAMRVGWRFVPKSEYRLVYATAEEPLPCANVGVAPVVVPSSPAVGEHLRTQRTVFPLHRHAGGRLVPFPQPARGTEAGWLAGDVVAGAHACLNLWYEQRTQPAAEDGWITYEQDWMAQAGLPDPLPLADHWLDMIYEAALQVGWPNTKPQARCTIVLTHDVDYLPGRWDFGLPRLARAVYRQLRLRRRPADAARLLLRYVVSVARSKPYANIPRIVVEEARRGARSSFQFAVASEHRFDPAYPRHELPLDAVPGDWEICLHGSYRACRTPGQVAAERARLEQLCGRAVQGYRQHYLNFEPGVLFREVARAGLCYDMSVGYNDRSGPRAGTYFPFRPYDLDRRRPYTFWEIPFVLMDTTIATSCRLGAVEALTHARLLLEPVVAAGGCVAITWHQEQCGGLLDVGFDHVYYDLLTWIRQPEARSNIGRDVLRDFDTLWNSTLAEE